MKRYLEKDERNRYIITTGKYEGEYLDDVSVEDPKFLRQLLHRDDLTEDTREAIRASLQ